MNTFSFQAILIVEDCRVHVVFLGFLVNFPLLSSDAIVVKDNIERNFEGNILVCCCLVAFLSCLITGLLHWL